MKRGGQRTIFHCWTSSGPNKKRKKHEPKQVQELDCAGHQRREIQGQGGTGDERETGAQRERRGSTDEEREREGGDKGGEPVQEIEYEGVRGGVAVEQEKGGDGGSASVEERARERGEGESDDQKQEKRVQRETTQEAQMTRGTHGEGSSQASEQEEELVREGRGFYFRGYGLGHGLQNKESSAVEAPPVFHPPPPPPIAIYDGEVLHKRFVDRAKRIDTISRAVFPLSFLIFNIFYWVTYKVLRHEDIHANL